MPPAERVDILNGRIAALQKEIDKNEAEIRTHKNRREDLLYTIDYFTMRTEKYDVLGRLWQSPHVFLINGIHSGREREHLRRSSRPRKKPTWSCATRVTRTMCP